MGNPAPRLDGNCSTVYHRSDWWLSDGNTMDNANIATGSWLDWNSGIESLFGNSNTLSTALSPLSQLLTNTMAGGQEVIATLWQSDEICHKTRELLAKILGTPIQPLNAEYEQTIMAKLGSVTIERNSGEFCDHIQSLSTYNAPLQLLPYAVYLSSNYLMDSDMVDKLLLWVSEGERYWAVEQLLGADIPTSRAFGSVILVSAARLGMTDIVNSVIDKGINANSVAGTWRRSTALIEAVQREDIATVRLLLDRGACPYAYEGTLFNAPLRTACLGPNRNLDIAQLLINHEACASVCDRRSHGSLFHSVVESRDLATLKLLLQSGVKVNDLLSPHGTALQLAAGLGEIDIVQLLLSYRADANRPASIMYEAMWARSDRYRPELSATALQQALAKNYNEIAEVLLESGADPNRFPHTEYISRYGDKWTGVHEQPILHPHFACHDNDDTEESMSWLESLEVNAFRGTPLAIAAFNKNCIMVQCLLCYDVDVNVMGLIGTALQVAAGPSLEFILGWKRKYKLADNKEEADVTRDDDTIIRHKADSLQLV